MSAVQQKPIDSDSAAEILSQLKKATVSSIQILMEENFDDEEFTTQINSVMVRNAKSQDNVTVAWVRIFDNAVIVWDGQYEDWETKGFALSRFCNVQDCIKILTQVEQVI